jgi:hypothetical protein
MAAPRSKAEVTFEEAMAGYLDAVEKHLISHYTSRARNPVWHREIDAGSVVALLLAQKG